ncbi:MAG TPA: zinc ribbon domain-containing protein [Thermoanaerobaculia bacterium]|nr:zinc ribbon domain-containing protein [Thermoanaerobaculia bacterium]
MDDARYCSNCRAELPRGADTCPACGVYAGDVFDGRVRRRKDRPSGVLFFLLVVLLLGTAAWWLARQRIDSAFKPARVETAPLPNVRVVSDRPGGARRATGAKISEAEAVRLLRRHLAEKGTRDECIATKTEAMRGGDYVFTALNSCEHTRLGRFTVDGATGAVTP